MSWWVIIGGTKPSIYHGCPYILCGRLSPPLPIAIECTSMDEAKLVMQTLDSILQPILPEPTTHDLVTFLNTSPAVQDLLKDTGLQDADVVGLQDTDIVAPQLTQSMPSQGCGHSVLGAHAAQYLTAHRYMHEAIDTIIHAHNGALSDHIFAL
ncbi:hypothetical protein F5J12DRAFT_784547 [Pisolithus orientalis]|uniref:uncharacterized protein n=1 Tax=Pisolithus orientalis TaxID=936130 RepID=UPI0022240D96|nr:uncharacterized protein F5J12DRAFT_784547 [Pisolithus orientalis]KAI5999769.1 hypothetical protein F5J12DRAFT_784547 [Pisolithus orientalis]